MEMGFVVDEKVLGSKAAVYHVGDGRLLQRTEYQDVGADVAVECRAQRLLATATLVVVSISALCRIPPAVCLRSSRDRRAPGSPPVVGVFPCQNPLILGAEHVQRERLTHTQLLPQLPPSPPLLLLLPAIIEHLR